ncbi:MAG: hypothetical protein P8M25_08260 [Paracoccaceae bacterium]|nr:hypothetical protein [Paracoccaceae bacterium]
MSDHRATITWDRGDATFSDGKYSRAHRWQFDGEISVIASASHDVVPLPFSRADAVDPKEAFVAALASCPVLWFLYLARRAGFIVNSYRDQARGEMRKTDDSGFLYRLCTCIPKPAGRAMRPTPSSCQTCNILLTTVTLSPIRSNPGLSPIWGRADPA